jgi:LuxR family maltose regulon positive regulatory protein
MRTVQLVKQNRHAMYNDDKWFVVEKWLSLIPRRMIRQSPELLLAQTWVYYYHSDFAHIPPTLDAAEALLRKTTQDQALQGEIDLFRGVFCFMQGSGERAWSLVEAALERIQEEHQMVRGFAEMYFGLAGQMSGRLERVVPYLSRLIDDPLLAFSRRMRAQTVLVWIYLIAGDFNAASSMNTQLRKMVDEKNSAVFATWSSYNQGLIHFWRNELDAAGRQFHRAAENRYLVLRRASVDCLAGLALTCQAMHQTAKSNEAVEQLSEYTFPFHDHAVNKILDSCKIRLFLMQEGAASMAEMSTVTEQPTDVGTMAIWVEIPEVTRCRILLADGSDASLREAGKRLKAYGELNRGHHNTLHLIETQVLLALVRHRQGRLEESMAVLEEAITMSEPGGIIRPFVEGGAPMAIMLGMLRQKKIAVHYVEKLLAVLADGVSTAPESHAHPMAVPESPQPLIEPLTNRELDILELLAKRLQNKEIAQELCIAPTTVKTHLRNIYQKLCAKGRRHAIERAAGLGILPHR